mgnify:CR=1 FL=1
MKDDPVWQAAMDWLLQRNANPDDVLLQHAHARWLAADERHRKAWRKAEQVWLLSGAMSQPEPEVAAAAPVQRVAPRPARRRAVGCRLPLPWPPS